MQKTFQDAGEKEGSMKKVTRSLILNILFNWIERLCIKREPQKKDGGWVVYL